MNIKGMLNRNNSSDLLKQLRDFSAGPLIGLGVSMLTVPIITRMVSPDEYGKTALFTLTHVLINFIMLLGLDQAFIRYYNTDIEKKKLLLNTLIFPFFVCLISIIGIVIFQRPLSYWLFGQHEPLIIIGLCFFLPNILINRFAMLLIRMDLRGKLYSVLNISSQLVSFICLLFLFLLFERSFRSIIFAVIIASLINTILALVFTKNVWVLHLIDFDKNLIKKLLHFGIPLVPATVLFWLLNSFDKIGLRTWGSPEELGLYVAAFKIVSLIVIVQKVFGTVWIPVAYKWYENGEDNRKFDQVSVAVLAVVVMGSALVVVFRDIIMLFLGYEYRGASGIFIYLLFVPVVSTVLATTALGIGFSKKTEFNLYSSIITVIVNIFFNYFLIPIYGAWGAAISTSISFLAFFWVTTLFSRSLWYKFGLLKYIVNFALLSSLLFVVELNLSRIIEIGVVVGIMIVNVYLAKKI